MTHTTEQERAEFEAQFKHLDLTQEPDAWGVPRYKHAAIWLAWEAWQAALRAPVPPPGYRLQPLSEYDAMCAFIAAAPQAAAHGMDAETQRHAAIGKAIERACADLPEETEIIVSLEKDAGTVTMIDQDGNEYENFSCDYGFAGVMDEAIDAAIAAQTKKEGEKR